MLAANLAARLRLVRLAQHFGLHSDVSGRSVRVLLTDPGSRDAVELMKAEPRAAIKGFSSEWYEQRLGESVYLGAFTDMQIHKAPSDLQNAIRTQDTSVTVLGQKVGFQRHVVKPHTDAARGHVDMKTSVR